MTEPIESADLCAQLLELKNTGSLRNGPQKTAERLIESLESDIRVVLLGPETSGRMYLQQFFAAQPMPRTTIRNTSHFSDLEFSDAEICIWCTSMFDDQEAAFWNGAPDSLKDHSFLVPIADKGTVSSRHSAERLALLGDIATEEFHGLVPVVLGPQASTEPRSLQILHSEIANVVRLGLTADADRARMFLEVHRQKETKAQSIKASRLPQAPRAAPPASAGPKSPDTKWTSGAEIALYQKALDIIRRSAKTLNPLIDAVEDEDIRQVLLICEDVSAEVSNTFSNSTITDPDFVAFREEAQSAADKILLLSLEQGVEPAIAAVTTILQIRRELEVQIAC